MREYVLSHEEHFSRDVCELDMSWRLNLIEEMTCRGFSPE